MKLRKVSISAFVKLITFSSFIIFTLKLILLLKYRLFYLKDKKFQIEKSIELSIRILILIIYEGLYRIELEKLYNILTIWKACFLLVLKTYRKYLGISAFL